MSSFTQNLPINEHWYSFDNIKSKLNSFNQNAELALKTAGNVANLYSLGSLGSSTVRGAIENNRRRTVNSSINSLNTMYNAFSENPEYFDNSYLSSAQNHLENIQKYTDIYSSDPLSQDHSNLILRYKDIANSFSEKFNPETFEDRRQKMIEQNNNSYKQNMFSGDSFDPNRAYNETMAAVEKTKDYIDRGSIINKTVSYFLEAIPIEFESAYNDYKENRTLNTREGITKSLQAINKASELVKKTKSSAALKVLMDMKYDYAVRSFGWRS